MIGNLARMRTSWSLSRLTALAVLVALIGAMYAATAPTQAQTGFGFTEMNPIVFDDSDGIVSAGTPVAVTVNLQNASSDTLNPTQVSLTVPSTGLSIGTVGALRATAPAVNNAVTFTINTAGAPNGDYPLTVAAAFNGNFSQASVSNLPNVISRAATLTIGDAGTAIGSATLAPAKVDPGTQEPSTAPGAVDARLTRRNGDTIHLTVTTSNSLGGRANSGDIRTIVVFAVGGTVVEGNTRSDNSRTLVGSASVQAFAVTRDTRGTVDVTATVIGASGSAETNTLTLTFSGPAAALSLSAASSTALNSTTGDDVDDTGADARDQISFRVAATDAGGLTAAVPAGLTVEIKDPDGKAVDGSKIATGQSDVPNSQDDAIALNVEAAAGATTQLASGEYTIKVTSGSGASAFSAEGTFTVVGPASQVAVTRGDVDANGAFTVTATVTDAGGNPVADGTSVTFSRPAGSVALLTTADTVATKAGVAEATYVEVGPGIAAITAVADARTGVLRHVSAFDGGTGVASDTAGLSCLTATSGFTSWTCMAESDASEVFDLVSSRGASALHLWNGSAWVRYSVVDGAQVPGSADFTITQNDILYVSN